MRTDSNNSWRARLLPIAMGYAGGSAGTILLTSLSGSIIHEIYFHPPSSALDFFLKVGGSVAWWLLTLIVGVFVYLAYTGLFVFAMALPTTVAIRYMEIHKIRTLWPYCLGAVLLWAVARVAFYFGSVLLKPMVDPKNADRMSLLAKIGDNLGSLHPSMTTTWVSSSLLMLITIGQGSFAGWIYWLIAIKRAGLVRRSFQVESVEPT